MAEEKKGQFPSSLKEARQHGSFSFPCAFYQAVPETNPPGFPFTVKHHWHEPVEIIYLEQDSYQVDINMTLTHLKSPCFCFINSGELHALTSDSEQYQEQAVVFSPDLLTFAAPDPAQEQFRNINFPFHLFLDLITRPFRKYSRNFSGSAQSFPAKTGAVWISLQSKVPFHNCGSR